MDMATQGFMPHCCDNRQATCIWTYIYTTIINKNNVKVVLHLVKFTNPLFNFKPESYILYWKPQVKTPQLTTDESQFDYI